MDKIKEILNFKNNRKKQIGLAVVLAIFLVVLSFVGNRHTLAIATMVFVYIALGQSWNLLSGFTGLFSIAHAIFYGLGVYSVISGARVGLSVPASIAIGLLLNIVMGAIVAYISRKLSGVFFTMAMIAMSQVLNSLVLITYDLTGGTNGIALSGKYVLPRQTTYWLLLFVAIAMTAIVYFVRTSKIGSHFVAVRENPELASSLGVNVPKWQFIAVEMSAIMACLTGCAYAFYALSTSSAIFAGTISLKIIIVVMAGGIGTIFGPWCGSFIIIVDEIVRAVMPTKFAPFSVVFYAIILILISMYRPNGVISLFGINDESPAFAKMIKNAFSDPRKKEVES